MSAIICLLLYLAWKYTERKQNTKAGMLVGIAGAIKLFPLVLVLFFILRKKYLGLATALVTFLFCNALAALVLGTDTFLYFYTDIADKNSAAWSYFPVNYSILGVLSELFAQESWTKTPLLLSYEMRKVIRLLISFVLVIGLFLIRNKHEGPEADQRLFSLCIIVMLLVSPITWIHIFPVLLIQLIPMAVKYVKLTLSNRIILLLAFLCTSIPDIQVARWMTTEFGYGEIPAYVSIWLKLPTLGLILAGWLALRSNCLAAKTTSSPGKRSIFIAKAQK